MDLRGTVGGSEMMFAGLLQKKRRDRSECCRMGNSASPFCSYVAAAGGHVFTCVVPGWHMLTVCARSSQLWCQQGAHCAHPGAVPPHAGGLLAAAPYCSTCHLLLSL